MRRYICLLGLLLMAACDPVNTISIRNETKDTAIVEAVATIHFNPVSPDHFHVVHDPANFHKVRFAIPPGEECICGRAISSLARNVPFEKILITVDGMGHLADNEAEVQAMFDKTIVGTFSTPYRIVLKP